MPNRPPRSRSRLALSLLAGVDGAVSDLVRGQLLVAQQCMAAAAALPARRGRNHLGERPQPAPRPVGGRGVLSGTGGRRTRALRRCGTRQAGTLPACPTAWRAAHPFTGCPRNPAPDPERPGPRGCRAAASEGHRIHGPAAGDPQPRAPSAGGPAAARHRRRHPGARHRPCRRGIAGPYRTNGGRRGGAGGVARDPAAGCPRRRLGCLHALSGTPSLARAVRREAAHPGARAHRGKRRSVHAGPQ